MKNSNTVKNVKLYSVTSFWGRILIGKMLFERNASVWGIVWAGPLLAGYFYLFAGHSINTIPTFLSSSTRIKHLDTLHPAMAEYALAPIFEPVAVAEQGFQKTMGPIGKTIGVFVGWAIVLLLTTTVILS